MKKPDQRPIVVCVGIHIVLPIEIGQSLRRSSFQMAETHGSLITPVREGTLEMIIVDVRVIQKNVPRAPVWFAVANPLLYGADNSLSSSSVTLATG